VIAVVAVTSADLDASEVSGAATLFSGDYAKLGVPDKALRSCCEHCANIVKRAEGYGFCHIRVAHQARAREVADNVGYTEPPLWAGTGRAHSGFGAALVGSTDQVPTRIEDDRKTGIRAFIFSGTPHMDRVDHFGTKVLPHLKTCSLHHAYGRVPAAMPATPVGTGVRL